MKLVLGLGNPGSEYDATRHNVGWWLVDRLSHDWKLGPFRKEGASLVAGGPIPDGGVVSLVKPITYMNRSGAALRPWMKDEAFDPAQDLLVVVDDATIDVGRVRFRASGSAGGHNGLKSIQAAVGSQDYARLRIGVGKPSGGEDLVSWVLTPMEEEDEDRVLSLFPELVDAVGVWLREGVGPAMNRFNR